ncbi:hypothetical protein LCGC14_2604810 [marine sediment metagenome]|uniref:Asparagine synthetase domain-containing protein n=1 Tax=marine sediment metagenome TaxID=412755 RepID=A0A0F9A7Y4_9ZZZZ
MIVYPDNWKRNYEDLDHFHTTAEIIEALYEVLKRLNVNHLAYSGGVDSTIMLAVMCKIFDEVHTYTISSRRDHPDVLFARRGSKIYNTIHHEFIVDPTHKETDIFEGDNSVRQLFELLPEHTDKVICCDGIDEFMCGYYDHKKNTSAKYTYYLSRLLPDHLVVLNSNSGNVKVFLPYLDERLVDIFRSIPLLEKVDGKYRKKIILKMAGMLGIIEDIIYRNKYGFVDAFKKDDK